MKMAANSSRFFGRWVASWLVFAVVSGQECEWAAVRWVNMEAREGVTRALWRPAGSSPSLAFVRLPHWKVSRVIKADVTSRRDLHLGDPCHEVIVRVSIEDDSAGRLATTYTLEIPSLGLEWSSSSSGRDAGATRGDPHDPPLVKFIMANDSYWVKDCAEVTCDSRHSNTSGRRAAWCKWLLVADLVAIVAVLLMASLVLLVLVTASPERNFGPGFKGHFPAFL
ncbi:hypothetical protein C7M84_003276 [Penaeus vannamei]|uniref:Uncharacterized protein n=1 Tax=Penaeus vannamei TaxID=6689 RepID=A0A3R7N5S2_PENVA|nr:hypothetical protein C7M84_003276 [Penaeus vannamei]